MLLTLCRCRVSTSTPLPQHLVEEDKRIRGKIPPLFFPLMAPHLERVEEVISPGLTMLRWTSLTLEHFLEAVAKAFGELELLVDRAAGVLEHRVNVVMEGMLSVPLCELPLAGVCVAVSEFTAATASLCTEAGALLDTKSQVIEQAVHELLELLLGPEEVLETPQDGGAPGATAMQKRIDKRAKLKQEADGLLLFFEQRNTDTLVQLTRLTLENIRKRVSVSSYGDYRTSHRNENPLFHADIVLALPSLVMRPSLEDVQKGLNNVVQTILAVTNLVYQWGQERAGSLSAESKPLASRSDVRSRTRVTLEQPPQASSLRSYFKAVADHREVLKLVSILSTAISSTKEQVQRGLVVFSKHQRLWVEDREQCMQQFLEGSPGVNEFSSEMQHYAHLEDVILTEPDSIPVGAVALCSEQLKIALCAEAKAWRVCYGRAMNHKYQTEMEEVFRSIDDWSKQLSHPLDDLDDIRSVMAALRDIRENEIRIDMALGPIEVRHCRLFDLILVSSV